jgi:hypothetical protein
VKTMPRIIYFVFACLLAAAACACLAGCSALRPPTALEERLFTITTNQVPEVRFVTNTVPVTNYVPVVVTITNQAQPAFVTNIETRVTWQTNTITATNLVDAYTFVPNQKAQSIQEGATAVGNLFGVGGLAGTLAGAVFSLWATLRSNKNRKTAEVLAQIIETGRLVLQSTPQGQQLDEKWKSWMINHQAESGVITEVAKLCANVVDNETARGAAQKLVDLMESK